MNSQLHADVLIFGGGIAGLWTLARLRREGFECILVEADALGTGQTIASQGIIHGGLKYALDGQVGSAASAIAAMPAAWQACLNGAADASVDLRGVPILSPHYFYWTSPGVLSRVAGASASKVMRTTVERVAGADRPEVLRPAPGGLGGVDIYKVGEMVLDARELVKKLASHGRGRLLHGSLVSGADPAPDVGLIRVRCHDGRDFDLRTQAVVLAAGAGNEQLLQRFRIADALRAGTQRRPLHMVLLRGAPAPFFGHCVGTSTSPRITITSGSMASTGEHVWYIGGQIAEDGVARSETEQVAAAKRELAECMPWLTIPAEAQWATLRIDRAEGVPATSGLASMVPGGGRPDMPVVIGVGKVIAAWPTKLAFAPLMAADVLKMLENLKVAPRADAALDSPITCLPSVAPHVWDREGVEWR